MSSFTFLCCSTSLAALFTLLLILVRPFSHFLSSRSSYSPPSLFSILPSSSSFTSTCCSTFYSSFLIFLSPFCHSLPRFHSPRCFTLSRFANPITPSRCPSSLASTHSSRCSLTRPLYSLPSCPLPVVPIPSPVLLTALPLPFSSSYPHSLLPSLPPSSSSAHPITPSYCPFSPPLPPVPPALLPPCSSRLS